MTARIALAAVVLTSVLTGHCVAADPGSPNSVDTGLRIAWALAIILACGVGGGYAAYLVGPPLPDELDSNKRWWSLRRALIFGVIAALVVPLFLELISAAAGVETKMMENLLSGTNGVGRWFVLVGLCLIAATSAQRFLAAVTNILLRQLQEQLKETKAEVQQVREDMEDEVQALQEDVATEIEVTPERAATLATEPLSAEASHILRAMDRIPLRRPSPEAIAQETGLSNEKVRGGLKDLESKELVQQRKNAPDGTERWRIRTRGKALLAELKK